jgi:hypothetical protein
MKTWELEGVQLDWAVAQCIGLSVKIGASGTLYYSAYILEYSPSTLWEQGGPIIEGKCINLSKESSWKAIIETSEDVEVQYGKTALVAAMRCYVTYILGEDIEIPEELK